MVPKEPIQVVGGGLAGSEAAWQIAQRGFSVEVYEMRPRVSSGAHAGDRLAELVCSNSLGSMLPDRASGVLMAELRSLGSLLLSVAETCAVPAGSALAVDREAFAASVTQALEAHAHIRVVRKEVTRVPEGPAVIASGPLTSVALARSLAEVTGEEHMYFFDALSPIVEADSIDLSVAFRASRYDRGEEERGDYVNCPLDADEYEAFVQALLEAQTIPLRSFEAAIRQGVRAGMDRFFEGCLPVEVLAERGRQALAYGPMRPVGLTDPRSGRRPHAVVQLRQDNLAGDLYNMVGFQTNLRYPEQRRVFRMIPGLGSARFARYGQMHRNTFVNSPRLLLPTLQLRARRQLFLAGQITGVEGYLGNIATGLLAGWNVARLAGGEEPLALPRTTMLGSLCHYVTHAEPKRFQPMKANFGILPSLGESAPNRRRERAKRYAQRSAADLGRLLCQQPDGMRIAT